MKDVKRSDIDAGSYTFKPWHPISLAALSHSRGNSFPAYLTARGGVSTKLVDMMRPLFNAGVKPDTFAKMVLEMQTKRHVRANLDYEHCLTLKRADPNFPRTTVLPIFSCFGDAEKYAGLVPTGRYFQSIYEDYHDSIAEFLDIEVKKRGAERLNWDVSYKEAKHLARYHGESIFKGLVTATNEVGEIRIQFHVVTDGFDQFITAIHAFRETLDAYGFQLTKLLSTDNPSRDAAFFLQELPSLRAQQAKLNAIGSDAARAEHTDTNYFKIDDPSLVEVVTTVSTINSKVGAIRESMLTPGYPLHVET